ncbi:Kinase suppressor of Ras 2, partial [Nibea albiflora]
SRREDKLRIPNGWLCHLAPEIIQQLSPDTEEDKLPFSKQSDVFAFGTIWYELHAREWPYKSQPAEVIIWQIGSGMKPNLAQTGMGKEISDILLLCWAYKQEERPSFSKLVDLLEKLPKRNRSFHPICLLIETGARRSLGILGDQDLLEVGLTEDDDDALFLISEDKEEHDAFVAPALAEKPKLLKSTNREEGREKYLRALQALASCLVV